MFAFCLQMSAAQTAQKVVLDTSETLFTVLTAINACGYDQELGVSDPLRAQVRAEIAKAIQASEAARDATRAMCQFYDEHEQPDPARTLAQHISLALYLNGPPAPFAAKVKEAELPPDAVALLGFVPLLQTFYDRAGLHTIWARHREAYSALTARYHEPLAKILFDTEIYLKIPSAGYLGRGFSIYVDPMGAPGQTNARNYGSDYFVVLSPGTGASLKMEEIRHTYLHYLLDPLALKYPLTMKRLQPVLDAVKTAPMDESFKNDITLLITECFIRAIEARNLGSATPPAQRQQVVEQAVDQATKQGFILTSYFYLALVRFEKDPAGLRNAYGDIVSAIDVKKVQKEAEQILFVSQAPSDLLHLPQRVQGRLLLTAESRLSAGDAEGAQKLAQEALDEKSEDAGRALFILAQVATMNRDMDGARNYFQRALEIAQEPKVVAWSHIYLGRIFDLQENREAALDHYRAALSAGNSLPEVKVAAERGLQQPYEPPSHPQ